MISAMTTGAMVLGRGDLLSVAVGAARFVRDEMLTSDGLRHVHAGGAAKVPAFLDDYAFFGRACLDLFAATAGREHFDSAVACAERLLAEFAADAGGFYFTSSRGEKLVARTCDLHDGSVPAGNSVAAELMLRLWTLTGEDRYRKAADGVIERFAADAGARPYGASWFLAVLGRYRRGLRTVVAVGDRAARERLATAARQVFDPGCTVIATDEVARDGGDSWVPSALQGKKAPSDGAAAYVCEGTTCTMPIVTEKELRRTLRRRGGEAGAAD
jgi:uncharacterized protein YyaL (SSP411 family)